MPFDRLSRRHALFAGGALALTPSISVAQATAAPSGLAGFWGRYLDGKFGQGATPGWAMALAKDGRIVARVGSGMADVGAGVAMTADTRLHIASASKPITAVALLKALEASGLDETATIGQWLKPLFPTLSDSVAELTVEAVLTHRTGISVGYAHSPRLETLRPHLEATLPPAPRAYDYSNINYSIARTVLEAVTGRTYAEVTKELVFTPSGVTLARLDAPAELPIAATYRLDDQVNGRALRDDFTDAAGAWGWYLTTAEMALFAAAASAGPLLSPELRTRMRRKELGWYRRPTERGSAYLHDGQWVSEGAGVHTGVVMLPGGWGAAIAANCNGGFDTCGMLIDGFVASWPSIESQISRRSPNAFVRIERPAAADEVRYTLDGSTPTAGSPVYSSMLSLPGNTRLKVLAFAGGAAISDVVESMIEGP